MVQTTLNSKMQKIARKALQRGLELYDRRHGYRGPIAKINLKKIKIGKKKTKRNRNLKPL